MEFPDPSSHEPPINIKLKILIEEILQTADGNGLDSLDEAVIKPLFIKSGDEEVIARQKASSVLKTADLDGDGKINDQHELLKFFLSCLEIRDIHGIWFLDKKQKQQPERIAAFEEYILWAKQKIRLSLDPLQPPEKLKMLIEETLRIADRSRSDSLDEEVIKQLFENAHSIASSVLKSADFDGDGKIHGEHELLKFFLSCLPIEGSNGRWFLDKRYPY